MNNTGTEIQQGNKWLGFAASVPGGGHIRYGIPCQDASFVQTEPRPAVIVCDGRGSAALSHLGAQSAAAAFRRQTAVMEPFLAGMLDCEAEKLEQWIKFCRIMYRTLMQVKYDLSDEHKMPEKEFDFTVAFAIAGTRHIGCFQVGDGAIVLRQNGACKTVFPPEKGEFANQTHFLRPGGDEHMKFQYAMFNAAENSGIAVTSDGPEHLMFQLSDMKPGKIFDGMFDDLRKNELCRQDIMDYLTRREWAEDPRGADDRSLALLINPGHALNRSAAPEAPANPVGTEKTEAAAAENSVPEKLKKEIPPVQEDSDVLTEKESSTLRMILSRRRQRRSWMVLCMVVVIAAETGLAAGWIIRLNLVNQSVSEECTALKKTCADAQKKLNVLQHDLQSTRRDNARLKNERDTLVKKDTAAAEPSARKQ